MIAHAAPTTQIHTISPGDPNCPARKPVLVKIMVPIMFDTTSAVALNTPICRRRPGFAAVEAKLVLF